LSAAPEAPPVRYAPDFVNTDALETDTLTRFPRYPGYLAVKERVDAADKEALTYL
jgi:hypothetical protein